MNKVISDFEKLLNRQATADERESLLRVKDTLSLDESDGLWPVLIALQHYQTLYEKVPASIQQVTEQVLTGVKENAEKIIQAETAVIQSKLAESVAETSIHIAQQQIKQDKLKTFAMAGIAVAMLVGVSFEIGRHTTDTVPAIVKTTAGQAGLDLAKQNPNLAKVIENCADVKVVGGRKACALPLYLDGATEYDDGSWLLQWIANIKAWSVLLLVGVGVGGFKLYEWYMKKAV